LKGLSRALVIIPSIFGHTGDVVNERLFLKSLCRGRYCLVISFIGPTRFTRLKKYLDKIIKGKLSREVGARNAVIIPMAIPHPDILVDIYMLLVSILLTPFIWILDRLIQFDIIYVRTSLLAFGLLSVNSLSRKTCVKIITMREDEVVRSPAKRLKRSLSLIYSLADRYALTKARIIGVPTPILLKRLIVRRGVLPKGKVALVPPGVDREEIEVLRRQTPKVKDNSHHIVGFVGGLAWWQGVDILVQAVARLKDLQGKPVSLLIVGDGPERKKIEKLCKELKVSCHITGFVKHSKALKYLANFDVFVVPRPRMPNTESIIPIKVIEAWALGVPVITTRHEIYELMGLRDKEDVIFCEPDPGDVAEKILMVIKNEELRKKLSVRGPQLAECFYYDKIVANLINAFEDIKKN